jgi:3-hydroxyacyl-[acyl-carrier-protein] dehydratase
MRWIWIDKFVEFNSGKKAMAQTAGILVGEVKKFQEKVILAKIKKAVFFDYVKPGDTIKLEAMIESIAPEAASTTGKITRSDKIIAEIDLMFSHIDQNLAGKAFPEENFVFGTDTSVFESLLREVSSGTKQDSERN